MSIINPHWNSSSHKLERIEYSPEIFLCIEVQLYVYKDLVRIIASQRTTTFRVS